MVYWTALGVVLAALVSLPLIEVDVTVSSPGRVRPVGEVLELRSPVAGLVKVVSAEENARVVQGQTLVEIAAPAIDERIARNVKQTVETAEVLADLQSLLASDGDRPSGVWRTARWGQAAARHRVALSGLNQQIEKLERDRGRIAALHAQGLVSDREVEDAAHAVADKKVERDLLVDGARAEWETLRHDEVRRREALVSEGLQLEEERSLYRIASPITGDLLGIEGVRQGQFVAAGQGLGTVSPDGRLRVEAAVDSRSIGFLRAGLSTRVLIDAFPHTEWGVLEGEIESVAPDFGASGAPAHRVLVRLASQSLIRPDGARGELRKGMGATVRFSVARRSLWHFFTQDATEWIERGKEQRTLANAG
jgi:multidrug resistance efflux pump